MAMTVGTLAHDGPATPHQIALVLPITANPTDVVAATCRYRRSQVGSGLGQQGAWVTGHPLHQVRPGSSNTPAVGSVTDAFAWTIIDLQPGYVYDVEVILTGNISGSPVTKSLTHTTRLLPPRAPRPTSTVTVGTSTANIKTAIEALTAGQCIQFDDGTHTLAGLQLATNAGTDTAPIYIRGTSREGTILEDTTGNVIELLSCDNVVIENLTIRGSQSDSGTSSSSRGIFFGTGTQTRITVRSVTIHGTDMGIASAHEVDEVLVYDCILVGNNAWTAANLDSNLTWSDHGIQLPGSANCAFRNTLKGFGDSFAYAEHSGSDTLTENIGIHYYKNDVYNSGDDLVEADHAHRNCTFHDNRCHNSMTALSLDPLYGGPFLYARNISINTGRTALKWTDVNTGHFIYNNTFIATTKQYEVVDGPNSIVESIWYQPNNGDQDYYAVRNNLFVYRGVGARIIRLAYGGNNVLDWTNNAWYPDLIFQFEDVAYDDLADIQATGPTTAGLFSSATKAFTNDEVSISNPWSNTITLGTNYRTEVSEQSLPVPNHASVLNQGVELSNITPVGDTTPDIGALQSGAELPIYGNNLPQWVKDLAVGAWYEIPNTDIASVDPDPAVSPGGTSGPAGKVDIWNSMAVDARFSDVYCVCNGGHGNYSGNEADVLHLERNTPAWEELLAPSPGANLVDGDYYTDGRPGSRHTYYGVWIDEWNDRVMIVGGSPWSSGGFTTNMDSYNIGSNSYSAATTHADASSGVATTQPTGVADPFTGDFYIYKNGAHQRWNRSSNDYTDRSITNMPTGWDTPTAFDAARGRFLALGGGTDVCEHTYDISGDAWTARDITGASESAVLNPTNHCVNYDPVLDLYLVRLSASGGAVHQIDPVTFEATAYSTTGGTSIPATSQGVYNRFLYVPRLGGHIYLPTYGENAWFLKTADVQASVPGEEGGGGGGETTATRGSWSMR